MYEVSRFYINYIGKSKVLQNLFQKRDPNLKDSEQDAAVRFNIHVGTLFYSFY